MLDMQVATHLKGLAEKAKLNVRHVKASRAYKARVTSDELKSHLFSVHFSD